MGLLSRSLFTHLISRWGFGVGWLGVAIHLKNSIALAIHSLDRSLALQRLVRRGSLSQSLFIPLIAPYKCLLEKWPGNRFLATLKAGARESLSQSLFIRFDRTLQMYKVEISG